MKKLLILSILLFTGCATGDWQSQTQAGSLANMAVTAAAKHYGGDKAASFASSALSAVGEVAQGYVGKEPPIDVITQSAGVKGVGTIAVDWLIDKGVVTQDTVNNIHKAAELAATITAPK